MNARAGQGSQKQQIGFFADDASLERHLFPVIVSNAFPLDPTHLVAANPLDSKLAWRSSSSNDTQATVLLAMNEKFHAKELSTTELPPRVRAPHPFDVYRPPWQKA